MIILFLIPDWPPFTAPQFTEPLQPCAVKEGGAAKFTCRVSGHPTPQITWYRDGEQLQEGHHYSMLTTNDDSHMLVITGCTQGFQGSYKCVATNCEGCVESEGELAIQFVRSVSCNCFTQHGREGDEEQEGSAVRSRRSVARRLGRVDEFYDMKEELGR